MDFSMLYVHVVSQSTWVLLGLVRRQHGSSRSSKSSVSQRFTSSFCCCVFWPWHVCMVYLYGRSTGRDPTTRYSLQQYTYCSTLFFSLFLYVWLVAHFFFFFATLTFLFVHDTYDIYEARTMVYRPVSLVWYQNPAIQSSQSPSSKPLRL